MSHPETILRTLDRHLARPTRLILYGRAALALGFHRPDPDFSATFDVDAILPRIEMDAIEADDGFWNALEMTNAELEPTGLYITHLFVDDQLILTPDWQQRLQSVALPDLRQLRLQRPSAGDLILTKMMRIDPQDRSDIRFLLEQLEAPESFVADYLDQAFVPDLVELQEAFVHNRAWLEGLLAEKS